MLTTQCLLAGFHQLPWTKPHKRAVVLGSTGTCGSVNLNNRSRLAPSLSCRTACSAMTAQRPVVRGSVSAIGTQQALKPPVHTGPLMCCLQQPVVKSSLATWGSFASGSAADLADSDPCLPSCIVDGSPTSHMQQDAHVGQQCTQQRGAPCRPCRMPDTSCEACMRGCARPPAGA